MAIVGDRSRILVQSPGGIVQTIPLVYDEDFVYTNDKNMAAIDAAMLPLIKAVLDADKTAVDDMQVKIDQMLIDIANKVDGADIELKYEDGKLWWKRTTDNAWTQFSVFMPLGGDTGQALVKKSNVDYDVEWQDVAGDGSLQNKINMEIAARIAGDSALASGINSEATIRSSADTALGTRIDSEETARTNADALMQTEIDGLKAAGKFVGSFATYAALPQSDSNPAFTSKPDDNDFVHIQADETHGGIKTQYVVGNIDGSGNITWVYDGVINDNSVDSVNNKTGTVTLDGTDIDATLTDAAASDTLPSTGTLASILQAVRNNIKGLLARFDVSSGHKHDGMDSRAIAFEDISGKPSSYTEVFTENIIFNYDFKTMPPGATQDGGSITLGADGLAVAAGEPKGTLTESELFGDPPYNNPNNLIKCIDIPITPLTSNDFNVIFNFRISNTVVPQSLGGIWFVFMRDNTPVMESRVLDAWAGSTNITATNRYIDNGVFVNMSGLPTADINQFRNNIALYEFGNLDGVQSSKAFIPLSADIVQGTPTYVPINVIGVNRLVVCIQGYNSASYPLPEMELSNIALQSYSTKKTKVLKTSSIFTNALAIAPIPANITEDNIVNLWAIVSKDGGKYLFPNNNGAVYAGAGLVFIINAGSTNYNGCPIDVYIEYTT